MKRALKILAALLAGTCVTGVALAFTALRPRRELVSSVTGKADARLGSCWQTRRKVFRSWRLSPPLEWRFERQPKKSRLLDDLTFRWDAEGWQYGPFTFEEVHLSDSWPQVVEQAARAELAKKSWWRGGELSFTRIEDSWQVATDGPNGRVYLTFKIEGECIPFSDAKK